MRWTGAAKGHHQERRELRRTDRFGSARYYRRLERERIHLLLLEDVKHGLADIAAGRTEDADKSIGRLQQARKARAQTYEAA
jgi:hypothetical protein